MNSRYTVELGFYKEFKNDVNFASYYELCYIAREMIYYNYLADKIMSEFLNSSLDIIDIINTIQIISIDQFMETGEF